MKKFLIALLTVSTIGCTPALHVINKPVERIPLNLQDPKPLKLAPVSFKVLTPGNQEKVFNDLSKAKQPPVFIGLTGTDYKNLAENLNSIKQLLIIQQEIIIHYRKYYEGH